MVVVEDRGSMGEYHALVVCGKTELRGWNGQEVHFAQGYPLCRPIRNRCLMCRLVEIHLSLKGLPF